MVNLPFGSPDNPHPPSRDVEEADVGKSVQSCACLRSFFKSYHHFCSKWCLVSSLLNQWLISWELSNDMRLHSAGSYVEPSNGERISTKNLVALNPTIMPQKILGVISVLTLNSMLSKSKGYKMLQIVDIPRNLHNELYDISQGCWRWAHQKHLWTPPAGSTSRSNCCWTDPSPVSACSLTTQKGIHDTMFPSIQPFIRGSALPQQPTIAYGWFLSSMFNQLISHNKRWWLSFFLSEYWASTIINHGSCGIVIIIYNGYIYIYILE